MIRNATSTALLAVLASAVTYGGCAKGLTGFGDGDDDGTSSSGTGGQASSGGTGGQTSSGGGSSGTTSGTTGGTGGAPECVTPADCDDGDACTTDDCLASACSHEVVDPDDGNPCTADSCDPATGVQHVPNVMDCTAFDDACHIGECQPATGACGATPLPDGTACDDGNACTTAEVCTAGVCEDPGGGGYVFYEPFADNSAGWQLGSEWAIGPTTASFCADSCPGDDPSQDHTAATTDNGVAGVVLGGCASTITHSDYCLTSPPLDTSAAPGTIYLSFWRHLHSDYPSYMTNKVDASTNGTTWSNLWTQPNDLNCINDLQWTQVSYDVTAYKSQSFRFRFCFDIGSSGVFYAGSWSVDDVLVAADTSCQP